MANKVGNNYIIMHLNNNGNNLNYAGREQNNQNLIQQNKIVKCKSQNCVSQWNPAHYPDITLVYCNTCFKFNCLKCDTIHAGENCEDYQKRDPNFQNERQLTLEEQRDAKIMKIRNLKLVKQKTEYIECLICCCEVDKSQAFKLEGCGHEFCKECLIGVIQNCAKPEVLCPYTDGKTDCNSTIQHREIRAFGGEKVLQRFLDNTVQYSLENIFHCTTTDCDGIWAYEEGTTNVCCPKCFQTNCHSCRAIHAGFSCKEYQHKLFEDSDPNSIATREYLKQQIEIGEAMHCPGPGCNVIIYRNEGCDWIQCSMCFIEICWVTKGPRWGPNGKGDTSGGCRCGGVKGIKCHQDCKYCH